MGEHQYPRSVPEMEDSYMSGQQGRSSTWEPFHTATLHCDVPISIPIAISGIVEDNLSSPVVSLSDATLLKLFSSPIPDQKNRRRRSYASKCS
ncbi:Heat shock 70 kDa protein 8 [Senna tora]|uniref:Heat shock 70 kDa protein 8 n=1 Tax=Senna tora TaxID=362788 RepID=A0A835CC52_9FABA|nr:Heat shock 70 kDa protein 8 [Senna tora]